MYGIEWCPIINTVYSVYKTSNKRGRYDIFQIFTVTYSAHQLNHPPAIRKWYINKPSRLGWYTAGHVSPGRVKRPKNGTRQTVGDETGELGASLCSTFCPATDRSAENTLSLRLGGWLVCYGMMGMWVGLIGGRFSQFAVADSLSKKNMVKHRARIVFLGARLETLASLNG